MHSRTSHGLSARQQRRCSSTAAHRAPRPAVGRVLVHASNNGSSSNGVGSCPTPAETARTIVDIVNEGALCSVSADGSPLGAPVAYRLDKDGQPVIQVAAASLEAANLQRDARVSLLVQPTAFPARGIASVALQGKVQAVEAEDGAAADPAAYKLHVDQCVYYGGLDNSGVGQAVSGDDYRSAEPDALRKFAEELITAWNTDRAEDIYRIVSAHLGVPLVEMAYAELLWLDRLGMYIRSEVAGGAPEVVRVPFYRPVIDERDARSVITMAAQLAWESERCYVPPLPAIFQDAASN
ncbi:MAG: glutamyl-tRNA reductase binding protein [Monoraphidium minutum]|nr:MAG: glutamyl-tRNA reductase binding protein [Monoraphidium minutum]